MLSRMTLKLFVAVGTTRCRTTWSKEFTNWMLLCGNVFPIHLIRTNDPSCTKPCDVDSIDGEYHPEKYIHKLHLTINHVFTVYTKSNFGNAEETKNC